MKRRSIPGTLGAVVLSLVMATTVLAADPVTNGSFENGSWVGSNTYYPLEAGFASGSAMTGWVVTSGTVDWIDGYWASYSGSRSVDLNGTPTANVPSPVAGTLTQTFTTAPNGTYFVSFYYAGNPDGGPAVKKMTVSATGGTPQLFTFDTTGRTKTLAGMGWMLGEYTFKATGTSTTLTFAADLANTSNQGIALDAVVIVEVLPTGALCKNGGWETMVDSASVPFRNQGDCVSYYATGEKNLANPTD